MALKKNTAHRGAHQLLQSYLGLRRSQRLLMIVENTATETVPLLVENCEALSVGVEIWNVSPKTKFDPTRFSGHDVVLFVQDHHSIFSHELSVWLAKETPTTKFFRIFGATMHTLKECFALTQPEQERINQGVLYALASSSKARIISKSGTDLQFSLSTAFTWISVCGKSSPDSTGTLPAGEVSTYSPDISGQLVVNGALNANFGIDVDPRLYSRPISLQIKNSKVTSFTTSNPFLELFLTNFFSQPNTVNVGEIGFGTNEGVKKFASKVCLANERYAGFHIGLGEHQQTPERVSWHCPLHLDMIIKDPTIYAEEQIVFANNRWQVNFESPKPISGLLVGSNDIV